ncbi:hypothetical protein [Jeotgalibacillus proteolyticus]|uniref:Uncharacterized protein n=1 Tax=Jeotgalibacillus proteolyticus TaxID=2082395 RepID=A0A2S5GAW6_9BACL|nr:hypothetical protein [Jeotgalibacillus proteolyticus]PPA70065.1 hypothetical protein C4B60_10760 [Jeotgalibacillus proteolyticus]
MAKTDLTLELERNIFSATNKQGVFGCFEVTIGWFGSERVDFLTYDTKGIWRCYEIKVSVSDFRSKAKNTFCGHYNYYVMPQELFEKVESEIPKHIGVYINGFCKKRAKKQELIIDEEVLKNSLIRSLARESQKIYKADNPRIIDAMNRRINHAEKTMQEYRRQYRELQHEVREKFGARWWA